MENTLVKPINQTQKEYKHLGFSTLETAEIVQELNRLLANYAVFYQKLRGFHWTVEGPDFFELHEKFEADYNTTKKNVDDIAERVRIFGQIPFTSMRQMIEFSDIKEPETPIFAKAMVEEVVKDIQTLLSFMVSVSQTASNYGDVGTLDLVHKMIRNLEKRHWMYSSWLKTK